MIQDQINLCSKKQNLRLKCYLCHNPSHSVNECHLLHYYPDREKIIKSHDFSIPQKRKFISRKIFKKFHYKIFKPISCLLKLTKNLNENDDSSSSEFNSDEEDQIDLKKDEYPNKKSIILLEDQASNRSNKSIEKKLKNSKLFAAEDFEQKTLLLNKSLDHLGNLEAQSTNFKRNSKLSPGIISNDKNIFKIMGETRASLNQSNDFPKSKRKPSDTYVKENEEMANSCFREPNDNIDQIRQFKKYFPQNNFSNVVSVFLNKNSLKLSKKKKVELHRISNYTFYLDSMYRILKKARRSSKKRSIQKEAKKKAEELIKINAKGKRGKQGKEVRRKYSLKKISAKMLILKRKKSKPKLGTIITGLFNLI